MEKFICTVCDYLYNPEDGDIENDVEAGTPFDDLPEDWVCPECGADLEDFIPEYSEEDSEDFPLED